MVSLGILGGGLSSLFFARKAGTACTIIEAEGRLGGLCRSFKCDGTTFDIGPHIVFSKNKEALAELVSLAPMNTVRRKNRIYIKGRYCRYPFENDLYSLSDEDKKYCLQSFIHNPYKDYEANNMLEFFYKTFGEGITRLYLEPYNRKIWKYETSFMNTRMVSRIPRPPAEDVIRSAEGDHVEGYTHQLYFQYPRKDGIESLVKGLADQISDFADIKTGTPVTSVKILEKGFEVRSGDKSFYFDDLVSSIPVTSLMEMISPPPPENVLAAARKLIYNAIHVTVVNAKKDTIGDIFSLNVPDMDISFHRLSKINFLGKGYVPEGTISYVVETTFRPNTQYDVPSEEISRICVDHLEKCGLLQKEDVNSAKTFTFQHAYVVYDSNHEKSISTVLSWLEDHGIVSFGRFGAFEYLNMDHVVLETPKVYEKFNNLKRSREK